MRIVVLSDTHQSHLTNDFVRMTESLLGNCDMIVHAGDFTSAEIYYYLKDVVPGGIVAVHGNMDPPELTKLLPHKKVFEVEGIKIGVMHGWGAPYDLEERLDREFASDVVDCIVYGHSHNPVNHKRGSVLFFNPGSPTDRHYAKENTVGYLTIQHATISGQISRI